MEYVNDPELAPGQTALAARRQTAGTAFAWAPGNEIDAFLTFVGTDHFAVVDGKLYKREDGGMLAPFDVTKPQIVLKPMAGDTVFLTPDEFKQGYTMVVAPEPLIVTVDGLMTASQIAALPTPPEPFPKPIVFSAGYTEPASTARPVPQDASSESPADAADEASAPPLLAPGEGTPARKPGRPKGSTNKATS